MLFHTYFLSLISGLCVIIITVYSNLHDGLTNDNFELNQVNFFFSKKHKAFFNNFFKWRIIFITYMKRRKKRENNKKIKRADVFLFFSVNGTLERPHHHHCLSALIRALERSFLSYSLTHAHSSIKKVAPRSAHAPSLLQRKFKKNVYMIN